MEKKDRKMPGVKEWLLILAAGALLLVFSLPDIMKKTEKQPTNAGAVSAYTTPSPGYAEEMEKKLTDLLLSISGVQKVKVIITMKGSSEAVVLKDMEETISDQVEEDGVGGKRTETTISKAEQSVLEDGSPYVTKQLNPRVEGVVILLQGGSNQTVLSVSEAVQALFDVPAHKVRIIKE